jgi:uncharacterized protein (TIGR02145 family)
MKKIFILTLAFLFYANLYSQEVIRTSKYTSCNDCEKEVCVVWEIIEKENPEKMMEQYHQLYLKVHLNTDALLLGEFKLRYRVSNDIYGNYSNEKTISIPLYSLEQFMEAHEGEFYLGEAFKGYTKDLKTQLVCDPDPNETKIQGKNNYLSEESGWQEVDNSTNDGNSSLPMYGSFVDSRDGKKYKTVKIGNQTWMAENLNYSTGNSWCYDNSSSNCNTYGRLYDWNTAKRACPSGWSLPSKSEFETLLSNVGGSGNNAYHALKDGGSSGFSALFGGWRGSYGRFRSVGNGGSWWSSSEYGTYSAWYLTMYSYYQSAYMYYDGKGLGLSVRCLQD